MKTYSFYALATGAFTGSHITCPDEWLGENTPADCGAIEGRHDPLCRRVNLATDDVEAYVPDAPADTALETWSWNPAIERWESTPTLASLRAARIDEVKAALQRQEARLVRPQREVLLAMLAGTAPDPVAAQLLQAINDNCAELRGVMAALLAAANKTALDAVTWSEPDLPL